MDLAQELERAVPDGPPLPPPETRAGRGRRALRRRRATYAVAAAGVAAAVAVPFAVAAGGSVTRGHDPAPPVGRPALSGERPDAAPGSRLERDPAAAFPWSRGEVAAATPFDGLLVRPGAVVLERVENLYPGKDTDSVALRLRFRGLEYWAALEWDEGGSTGQTGSPRDPFYSGWEDFLAKATSGGGMTSGPPPRAGGGDDDMPTPVDLPGLRWTGDGIALGGPGRVLEKTDDVDLGPSFAGADDPTGAALVELPDSTRVLVLYRETGGDGQLIAVTADGEGDSLADQLGWARQRYRDGVGLL